MSRYLVKARWNVVVLAIGANSALFQHFSLYLGGYQTLS